VFLISITFLKSGFMWPSFNLRQAATVETPVYEELWQQKLLESSVPVSTVVAGQQSGSTSSVSDSGEVLGAATSGEPQSLKTKLTLQIFSAVSENLLSTTSQDSIEKFTEDVITAVADYQAANYSSKAQFSSLSKPVLLSSPSADFISSQDSKLISFAAQTNFQQVAGAQTFSTRGPAGIHPRGE
jgi:hypothetical protein